MTTLGDTMLLERDVQSLDEIKVRVPDDLSSLRRDRWVPRSWFEQKPEWFTDGIQKIRVDAEGRAAGYFFQWGDCLLNGDEDECWSPPPSPTGYEWFHQGDEQTAEGDTIKVGLIGGGGEHADVRLGPQQAALYYADISKQKLAGRIYEDEHGGYFLGRVLADVADHEVDQINRSSLSGDWRYSHRAKGYDCVGPWLVTRPGLPLDRRGFSVDNRRSGFVRLASAQHGDIHPVYLSSLGGTMAPQPKSPPQRIKHAGRLYRLIPEPRRAQAEPPLDLDAPPPGEEEGGGDLAARVSELESRVQMLEDEMASKMGREEESAEVVALAEPVL